MLNSAFERYGATTVVLVTSLIAIVAFFGISRWLEPEEITLQRKLLKETNRREIELLRERLKEDKAAKVRRLEKELEEARKAA